MTTQLPTTVIGIDPGKKGAVAVFKAGMLALYPMPYRPDGSVECLDVPALWQQLEPFITSDPKALVAVERVTPRPRQAGTWQFGVSFGRLLGLLEAHGIKPVMLPPAKWKGIAGLPPAAGKDLSCRRAAELWPAHAPTFYGPRGGLEDGKAEAALIAYVAALEAVAKTQHKAQQTSKIFS